MRRHFLGMIGASLAAAAAALAVTIANTAPDMDDIAGSVFLPGNSGRPTTKRGKHKLPRHGQKLKSCRNKISRRVRRKHRRASHG